MRRNIAFPLAFVFAFGCVEQNPMGPLAETAMNPVPPIRASTTGSGGSEPTFEWVTRGSSTNGARPFGVTVDHSGEIVATGRFAGTADFGGAMFTSVGGALEIVTAKYDANGNLLWVQPVPGAGLPQDFPTESGGSSTALAVAVDPANAVFVAGQYATTATFGSTTLPFGGNINEGFLAKYDASGNAVWAQAFVGSQGVASHGLAVDQSGNAIVTGQFAHHNLGGNVTIGGVPLTTVGGGDIFVAKFDANGALQWVNQYGSSRTGGNTGGSELGKAMAVDAAGNSYATGRFAGTVPFGGTTLVSPASGHEMFLVKHDPAGNVAWASQSAGTSTSIGVDVALDASGEIGVVGLFQGTLSFGSTTLISVGGFDSFIARFDGSGNPIWVQHISSAQDIEPQGITIDGLGNTIVTGAFAGTALFGSESVSSAGAEDIFVAAYDPSGTLLWVKVVGGTGSDIGGYLTVDPADDVVLVGSFQGTVVFDAFTLNADSPGGSERAFLVGKMSPVEPMIDVDIDIKPGSDPNSIQPKSMGLVSVAILGSEDFDVADVNVTTLEFGPGGATPAHEVGGHLEDVNNDGFTDLVSHYRQKHAGLQTGDTEACITGEITDGTRIHGCDTVGVL